MHVKPHHPLQELLAKLLFSIETVPVREQRRMVNRACREAVDWHNARIKQMQLWLRDMEKGVYVCPECDCGLSSLDDHAEDCKLLAILVAMKN